MGAATVDVRRWALPLRRKPMRPTCSAASMAEIPRACQSSTVGADPHLHRISRRSPRHAVERIDQPFAPCVNRIVFVEQFERTDPPRPLELAENEDVPVIRRRAAEELLRL